MTPHEELAQLLTAERALWAAGSKTSPVDYDEVARICGRRLELVKGMTDRVPTLEEGATVTDEQLAADLALLERGLDRLDLSRVASLRRITAALARGGK
jgi:hypothetical protein